MSTYFLNLAKIFWHSEYYLYHVYSFFSHYQIFKKFSGAQKEEITKKTDLLFLGLMSVSPVSIENEQKDETKSKISSVISSSGIFNFF